MFSIKNQLLHKLLTNIGMIQDLHYSNFSEKLREKIKIKMYV